MLENEIFWEKFRPKKLNQVVILPRIENFIKNGNTNILMHGHMGTGKSTIIKILLKNKNCKIINASLKNGVDLLREELYDFCTSMPSPFNKSKDKMKYVYLEEFDRTTSAFQDAFKAFIEEYHEKVRFLITMNHIENIIPELISRFTIINFNPQNNYEKDFLKSGYLKYLKSIINYLNKNNDFYLNDDILIKIINKNFPDLRSSVQDIQHIYITKDSESYLQDNRNFSYIFDYIINHENDPLKNFDFVENNFLDDPITLLKALGRPFIKFLIENKNEVFNEKGFLIIKTSKEHNETFNNQMVDPIIHLSNYINELKKIII